ncbi:hypothetical protein AWZ03_003610 [Drosophila navojoa]|uniref:Cytochrome P450 n=1 Tax=Drosophila navojoa TaxID=7232 RepID=A0A484BPW8_DRONA|nr:hypothetical protein AWZ03_003610 [Drosophila navojoa]
MSLIGCAEAEILLGELEKVILPGQSVDLKPILNAACANMFSQYMCSMRFEYDDEEFKKIVWFFDEIFWEINQGHPLDFLPWLSPFYRQHTNRIAHWSTTIRKFILDRVLEHRELNIDPEEPDTDFTDALLKSLIENENMCRNTIIFMLEDFIGGHSAVGNLIMLVLAYIAKDPAIGRHIQCEADLVSNEGKRSITLEDMELMPYTMATIFEVLRYSSSPIVPHVATEDSVISGFGVMKGTITKDAISNMRELIRRTFRSNNTVKTLRFLFGNNRFMPSESYTIHIPHASISKYHGDLHSMPDGPMNQTLLQLLTCEELYTLWSTELKTTNVFLELELLTNEQDQQVETWKLFPREVLSQLPRSCKNVHLHLLHETDKSELQCCKELTIYEDIAILNLNSTDAKVEECIKGTEETTGWWQADVIVRGFKAPKFDLWSS